MLVLLLVGVVVFRLYMYYDFRWFDEFILVYNGSHQPFTKDQYNQIYNWCSGLLFMESINFLITSGAR